MQPDDPLQTFRLGQTYSVGGAFPLVAWSTAGANSSFDPSSITQVRLISARLVCAYIGDTLTDGGLIIGKSNGPDWVKYDSPPFYGLPNDPSSPGAVDFRYPLREGFEYVFLPEDMRSRTYAPVPRPPSAGETDTVRALAAREYDKWPNLAIFLEGGKGNAEICSVELICNWEVVPRPGTILSRVAPPPAALNSKALDRYADLTSALAQVTQPVASRAQTNPVGGIANFFMENLLNPIVNGVGRAAGRIGGQAVQGLLGSGSAGGSRMGRLPPAMTSPFIEELPEEIGEGVLALGF